MSEPLAGLGVDGEPGGDRAGLVAGDGVAVEIAPLVGPVRGSIHHRSGFRLRLTQMLRGPNLAFRRVLVPQPDDMLQRSLS